ncbi:hypothetical protein LDENG_00127840 [Lucifuga dentata]|nr:hypothetical protein LDENG_00127840 [Lucifuga dentata]
MEALCTQTLGKDGVTVDKEEQEQEEGEMEASSIVGSTDEETDEDSEPEPPPVIRRKVSFADAFGLNLVSVKEFDNADVTESGVSNTPEKEVTHPLEEFYMSCLFTVPSSTEELDQRLQVQMVELESIELLPGTTTLHGIIRVVNLCYNKAVYIRITLDGWISYFEMLAEYVPGSSDRKTDRFNFNYSLAPPFERDGTRVEFCLRYETSIGTFWANNKDMNYVLFCHQKGHVKEQGSQVQEDSSSHRSKRSCLKANRRGSAVEKARETINTATVAAEAEAARKAEEAERKTVVSAEIRSSLYPEEHKPLVDIVKSRHRAAHLPHVEDYFFQRRRQVPKAYSGSEDGLAHTQRLRIRDHHPQPAPTPWDNSARLFYNRQKKQSSGSPQVLTYHQIPLLTLDWNDDKSQQWRTAEMDICSGGTKTILSKVSQENIDTTPSVSDIWEAFLNGTDETINEDTSVCDAWQAFLNGPGCKDHSSVPESEWLQTAASVSPSNDKKPQTQNIASNQEHTVRVGTDTTAHLHAHTSAVWQPLSPTHATLLANVALNTADNQPAEACIGTPRDDNTATLSTPQKSQMNSVTDTLGEFGLTGAEPVSEGSFDSLTRWHEHAIWEGDREGKIVRTGGIGRDERSTTHIADFVTSSGETETTDMTAMPESQNANAVDRISQGARLEEGLFSLSGEREATGTAHNVMDDMLAFRETIRQETKDGERFVFTFTQGEEERPFAADELKEISMDTLEQRWTHIQEGIKGQKEDAGSEITLEEATLTEDTSAELKRQPEVLKGKEGNTRRRYQDERDMVIPEGAMIHQNTIIKQNQKQFDFS